MKQRFDSMYNRIEAAHREVQAAQDIAYRSTLDGKLAAPLRVRWTLNRAQSLLIKLLVRSRPIPEGREVMGSVVERRDVTDEIDHEHGSTVTVACRDCGNEITVFCYQANEGEPVEEQAQCCGYGYGLATRGYDLLVTRLGSNAQPAGPCPEERCAERYRQCLDEALRKYHSLPSWAVIRRAYALNDIRFYRFLVECEKS